jgi:predicted TIM-barrel fold metal-dependent hydrolase
MPPNPPSFYAKRNCYYGASSPSRRELAGRHEIGIDHILWGTDYPHYEGTFPHTRKALRHTFHDVPRDEARAILGENAARLYGFDLEKLAPLAARFGPTPAEVSQALPADEIPQNVHTNAFR